MSRLDAILERKRREVLRRQRRAAAFGRFAGASGDDRREATLATLRRPPGALPRVIAEVKFRSPSAGVIRERVSGEGTRVALAYVEAGAAAVSVLADGPGFGGSALEVRRIARAVGAPVLFKEFVLHEVQLDVAKAVGASLVLLLVRALPPEALGELVEGCAARALIPVVEAVDEKEVALAQATSAPVIGVNARDLGTFEVDPGRARRAVGAIDERRVRVYMSGVATRGDLEALAEIGVDAALVGTSLMRADDPGARLAGLLERGVRSR